MVSVSLVRLSPPLVRGRPSGHPGVIRSIFSAGPRCRRHGWSSRSLIDSAVSPFWGVPSSKVAGRKWHSVARTELIPVSFVATGIASIFIDLEPRLRHGQDASKTAALQAGRRSPRRDERNWDVGVSLWSW